MSEEEEAAARIERLRLGIQELLDLCASNNVEVPDHLKEKLLDPSLSRRMSGQADALAANHEKLQLELLKEDVAIASEIRELLAKLKATQPGYNVALKNGSYKVTNVVPKGSTSKEEDMDHSGHRRAKQKIRTVKTESLFYKIFECLRQKGGEKVEKVIFEGANLYLEAGKLYLILGSPGSGKSTLLKMISRGLHLSNNHKFDGKLSVCGIEPTKDVVWTNLVGYIDQIDRLHPFLTVEETCKFAWLCRSGGTHHKELFGEGADVEAMVAQMDAEFFVVKRVLELLGLARVKNTFVGDSQKVRGVSGGEKKRVTVAEMMVLSTPVCCMDEISTGLDAATTYDITRDMAATSRVTSSVRIVSLLQPPPETVANFDELILLSDGQIIFCGPVDRAIPYFEELGYQIPERMDAADWLQALSKDGSKYLKDPNQKHLTTKEFHDKFYASEMGKTILEKIDQQRDTPAVVKTMATVRYRSTAWQCLKLLIDREFSLWWRDKYQIKAKIMQTVIMGTIVGTVYFQLDDLQSVVGVLFQSIFFVIVGGMTSVIKQFPARSIFYKQQDANFFPTWCYIAGRSLASIPNSLLDATIYGTAVYFLAGLAYNDGATIGSFFLFWLLLFIMSLTSGLFFGFFSAGVQTLTVAQACMALTAILFVLFSGFTVQPDVIPDYYIWLYYLNFTSWALRGLVVNEFDSGKYDTLVPGTNYTEGQLALIRFGFVDGNGDPYTRVWAWYALFFAIGSASIAVLLTAYFLDNVRFATGQSLVTDQGDEEMEVPKEIVQIPFPRVTLTFEDVRYVVQSSITKEELELLKNVDGVVAAGKMTAVSSKEIHLIRTSRQAYTQNQALNLIPRLPRGAGKTTLMDVLALRKSTGEVTGRILLNGHPQEEKSFRRCTGYVEQFDTQSPQLTIRETVEFSAQLRLDEKTTPSESIPKFVDQILYMLELTNLQDLQVGSDEEGGLSFEQRKRLSIAVEVAANPSILFLDEPTSGLDARAAAIVMRGMRRIASEGRAVCATIHQPSVAIFNDFDSLLLLKRGGEVVFHGDIGQDSENLIHYFERYDTTPRIQPGENPATWMLTAIGAGSHAAAGRPFDYAGCYAQSDLHKQCLQRIKEHTSEKNDSNKVVYSSRYATSKDTQVRAVFKRAFKIYFRSPAYNVTRVMVSLFVALLFASVYAAQRVPKSESDMNSRVNSVFIATLFLCVNAQNTVLGVFEFERNMYYRHKAAGMYRPSAVAMAFTFCEIPFVFLTSTMYVIPFYFIMGFDVDAGKFFLFYLFVTLGFCSFTFLGQMFVSLLRDAETAQVIGGVLVSTTAMFSGIMTRPSEIPIFWIFMYWITPGHYIFEGIFMSQYENDYTPIEASPGSPFFRYLGCSDGEEICMGTAEVWVQSSFSDWSVDSIPWNILFLIILVITTRLFTFVGLKTLDYRAN